MKVEPTTEVVPALFLCTCKQNILHIYKLTKQLWHTNNNWNIHMRCGRGGGNDECQGNICDMAEEEHLNGERESEGT